MKVQNLAIIFLVIVIPLTMILSYYLNLQRKTLELQAQYDTKLAEATKEGIKAFEVNTVEWSNSKQDDRQNTKAMINAFITSLSNNLNVTGTAREFMVNYIPAIAVTMYDGYYIYAPIYAPVNKENEDGIQLFLNSQNKVTTSVEKGNQILYVAEEGKGNSYTYEYTTEDGSQITEQITGVTTKIESAQKEYKHTLNSKIAYSSSYTGTNGLKIVINYTLDNRIYLYGTKGSEYIEKDGYLVYFGNDTVLPRITINEATPENRKSEADITVKESIANTIYSKDINNAITNKTEIQTERLTEQILYKDENSENYRLGTFSYVYNIVNKKLYYDVDKDNFFTLNKDKTRAYIKNTLDIKAGTENCEYKSVSLLLGDGETTEYKKIYQVLNGRDKGKWYINIKEDSEEAKQAGKEEIDTEITSLNLVRLGLTDKGGFAAIDKDYSAINYYVEAYAFTNWVKQNLGGNSIFDISKSNDPEDPYSPIVQHKREIMKNSINSNLNLSISNYSNNGKYGFKLPELTDKDWEQVFSNISLITFFQGVPIGLKYYNNYAIATSTTNREYVDPNEIYLAGEGDSNYHRVYCKECKNIVYTGYRSAEYVLKEYVNSTNSIYYYEHDNRTDKNAEIACYYCAINRANYKKITNDMADAAERTYKQAKAYNEALARERYYQEKSLAGKIGIRIAYHYNVDGWDDIIEKTGLPDEQEAEIGATTTISTKKPAIKSNNQFAKYVFDGWATTPEGEIKYKPGDSDIFVEDVDLYAKWRISLAALPWKLDYYWNADTSGFETGTPSDSGTWSGPWSSGVYGNNISYIKVDETSGGSRVQMVGNSTNPGKGATWATFESEFLNIAEFKFDYKVNKGDSFNAAGFMFNVTETDTTLEGYMLSINFAGTFYSNASANGAIYKFTYYKGKNSANVEQIRLIESLPIGMYNPSRGSGGSGTITITVTDTGYNISCTELTKDYFIPVANVQPNTFGFFSDHYSHNCNQIGYFALNNIKVTVVRDK